MPITILKGDWRPAIRPLGSGRGVAAIGDVHGQDDLFAALVDVVLDDLADADERTVVQLGDLVDRGPGSLAALRRARAGVPGAAFVTLKGNHEDTLIAVLDGDAGAVARWAEFGGLDVAREAGISMQSSVWRDDLRRAVGEDLVDWVRRLPTLHRVGDLVFVHAGIDPEAPLDAQDDETLIWTRRRWLTSAGPYAENVAVIHGHTPQRGVDLDHPHRVNLDTGAFRTGVLSALVVVGERMQVVQAARR